VYVTLYNINDVVFICLIFLGISSLPTCFSFFLNHIVLILKLTRTSMSTMYMRQEKTNGRHKVAKKKRERERERGLKERK
jgi:hypothetical protein